jgi:crotonobetainyl-CoA:carnitine CoA-transferase CaiB-like acyl-CoA transferase
MGGVLEGMRVLDFGRYIAGPYCATLLAEFGAEVIRVEKRDGSEDRFVAPVGEGGEGALFLQTNRNEAGGTGGDASAGYYCGRRRRQSAAADSAR